MNTEHSATLNPSATGLILLAHPVHWTISSAEMVQALSTETHALSRVEVSLDEVRVPMHAAGLIDWVDARQRTEQALAERLRPLLEKSDGYHVAYFGAAPIPLAMFLGFRVGTWATVHPFQKRHDSPSWRWQREDKTIEVKVEGVPRDKVRARGDVAIRVATSHAIDLQDVRDVVPEAIAEISIQTAPTHTDALSSAADLEAVATEFVRALDAVIEHCPNAQWVHVFVSAPVGMAFRLGACVSPTKHPRVKTYQYMRESSPKYAPAIVLQEDGEPTLVLDDVARDRAGTARRLWDEERARLAAYGTTLKRHAAKAETWLPTLFQDTASAWNPGLRLAALPPLWKAGFENVRVGQGPSALAEFRFDPASREWQFGDVLLAGIARQVPGEDDLRRAGRMFLLHEGLHEVAQGLTSATSARIGRFPKLLEEVDYVADVWAMLHDYALERDTSGKTSDARAHLLKCIDVALGSFWGFDDRGTELREVQVRRLHRYLIWTWQRLRLEQVTGGEPDVIRTLLERPMLELAGPPVVARRERVYFDLDPKRVDSPELMVLDGNRAQRYGTGPGTPVANILEGFRRRDSTLIRDALQGVFDQVRRAA
ncbi:SAVED domain-containing protein [Sorangium sp. So ce381]|uniref:SAVED domain-containing protein n=1 Tax=Sorangium sp. So ce381 TaxID=3133307 RepID=UPI003F5B6601